MKSATLIIVLLIGLAVLGSGCASMSPTTASYFSPSAQDEVDREQPINNAGEYSLGWDLLYWTFYNIGYALANR